MLPPRPQALHKFGFCSIPTGLGNLSSYDIYGGEMRWIFKEMYNCAALSSPSSIETIIEANSECVGGSQIFLRGLDRLSGTLLSGTEFYIKRAAFSGLEPPKCLGHYEGSTITQCKRCSSCGFLHVWIWHQMGYRRWHHELHSYNLQTVITSSSSDYYNWVLDILPYRLAFFMHRSWRISSLASTCIAGGGNQSIAVRQGRHLWALLQPILQTLWSSTRDIPLACKK